MDEKARTFFEDLWERGDPWELETSEFERGKYKRQFEILKDRSYARALELGCGAGCFTRMLALITEKTVALDISPSAISRARAAGMTPQTVDFRVGNIMKYDLLDKGPWDLIVLSETIYYIGWLYSFFDVAMLAAGLFASTNAGGRFLMANTFSGVEDYLLRPWLIRTYRDLFLNVGYHLEAEEIFKGIKSGVELEVMISLFKKTAA